MLVVVVRTYVCGEIDGCFGFVFWVRGAEMRMSGPFENNNNNKVSECQGADENSY